VRCNAHTKILSFDVRNLVFVWPVLEQGVQQSDQVAGENKRGRSV